MHIHPFLDGNGRTSRLLSTLCLYRAGYDFKRLFTISEYYDRDRPAFYRAIQSVRESGMDMTGWLEYFVEGLTAQLAEVRERGEQAIRRDVLIKEHRLSDRQAKALGTSEHGSDHGSRRVFQAAVRHRRRVTDRVVKPPLTVISSGTNITPTSNK